MHKDIILIEIYNTNKNRVDTQRLNNNNKFSLQMKSGVQYNCSRNTIVLYLPYRPMRLVS